MRAFKVIDRQPKGLFDPVALRHMLFDLKRDNFSVGCYVPGDYRSTGFQLLPQLLKIVDVAVQTGVDDGPIAMVDRPVAMGIIRMAIEGPPLYRSIGVLFIGAAVALAIALTAQYVDAFTLLGMLCLLVYLLIIHRIWNDNKYMVAQEASA